jgi:hypothetical protein
VQVRHNTSLLEEAVQHIVRKASIPVIEAEAKAHAIREQAMARRRLATGAAIAIACMGAGWGLAPFLRDWWLAPRSVPETSSGVDRDTSSARSQSSVFPFPESTPAEPSQIPKPLIVTTDYTKFNHTVVTAHGRTWSIDAGHHYASENEPAWDRAWCYTNADAAGVQLNVSLAERDNPSDRPSGPLSSAQTLKQAGLSVNQAIDLASSCPWNDRQFSATEIEVTQASTAASTTATSSPLSGPFAQFASFSSETDAVEFAVGINARWQRVFGGKLAEVESVPFGNSTRFSVRLRTGSIVDAKRICEAVVEAGEDCFARDQ